MKIMYSIKLNLIMNKVFIIVQESEEVIVKMDKEYSNIILKIYKNLLLRIKNYAHYNMLMEIMEICIRKIVVQFKAIY